MRSRLYLFGLICLLMAPTEVLVLAQSNTRRLPVQPTALFSDAPLLPPALSSLQDKKARARATTPRSGRPEELGFAPPVAYGSGGYYAYSVAVADVNGDGKPDLVVANCASSGGEGCGASVGMVDVLLGNGDGTFQTAVSYSSGGNWARSVAVADVNGDGKPDLVVANCASSGNCGSDSSDGTVGVLLGNGDGTFQSPLTYDSGGYIAWSVAVADVNGDGKPDLVVANVDSSTVGVLLGNGDGTFQSPVTYGSGGYGANSIAVADVNGDGKPDLLLTDGCANRGCGASGLVGVLLGNGDGTFREVVTYGSGGYVAISAAVADVNGDGWPDLVVANSCGDAGCTTYGLVGVLLNNGDGTFQSAVTYASGYGTDSVAVADVNGDDKPDLVVANICADRNCDTDGTVGVLLGNGDGTFQSQLAYDSGGSYARWVTAKDLNGDSRPDIVVANQCADSNCVNGSVGVLINTTISATSTNLSSSLNPSRYGQSVTLTAVVSSSGSGIPNGNVTFYDGANSLGTVLLANGTAALTTSALAGGTHSLTAAYAGGGFFEPSVSPVLVQTVARTGVSLTITSSVNPSFVNQSVTYSLVVAGNQAPPTGTVTFKQGTKSLGTAGLIGGEASVTTTFGKVGGYSIRASYSGDQNYLPKTSKVLKQVVNKYPTITTLTSSPNPSKKGQPVTLAASVSSGAPSGATGSVTFRNGSTQLGKATLSAGTAVLTTTKLPVGTLTIEADYSGDTQSAKSSGTTTQIVN